MLIQETFLKDSDNIKISRYNVHRKNKTTGRGEGTMIVVKRSLELNLHPTPTTRNIEAIKGSIKLSAKQDMHLISAYKPPHNNIIKQYLDELLPRKETTIMTEDLNSKHVIWHSTHTNNEGKKLLQYYIQNDVIPHGPVEHTQYSDNDLDKSKVTDVCYQKTTENH